MLKPSHQSYWSYTIWVIPFLAALLPAWMAWHWTCSIPYMDHWGMFALPLLDWHEGETFWSQVHEQANDSRYDIPRLLNMLIIQTTHWDLRIESLSCVLLTMVTAFCFVWLCRLRMPSSSGWSMALAAIGTLLLFSPLQWMNWTFSVQTCYALVVLFKLLLIVMFESRKPLWLRALLAGLFAALACHSFIAGWVAWVIGSFYLIKEVWLRRETTRSLVLAVSMWLLMLLGTSLLFFSDYKSYAVSEPGDPALIRLHQNPAPFARFFLDVIGAPIAAVSSSMKNEQRLEALHLAAPIVSITALLLLIGALWTGFRGAWKGRYSNICPYLMMIIQGLLNAAAVTLGRTGVGSSSAFESRYIAFTLWFHVGLLGVLISLEGRRWFWLRVLWILVILHGWYEGLFTGLRAAELDFNKKQIMASAGVMRHVAPQPELLEQLGVGNAAKAIEVLDQLDAQQCLHIPTERKELVKDSRLATTPLFKGALKRCEVLPDGNILLRCWAMNTSTLNLASAVFISCQAEGKPEKWLGLATRRLIEKKNLGATETRAIDKRLGWEYTTKSDQLPAFAAKETKATLLNVIPSGKVTFRAYSFDLPSATFNLLDGSFETEIK